MDTEVAYLFRHVVMRDAAYQLQLPTERSKLHGLALDVLQEIASAFPDRADSMAPEIAQHARFGQDGAQEPQFSELANLELKWQTRAAEFAKSSRALRETTEAWQLVAKCHAASPVARCAALLEAASAARYTNPALATRLLDQYDGEISRVGDRRSMAMARCVRASLAFRTGQHDQAVAAYGSAADDLLRVGDAREAARLFCELGGIHIERCDSRAAEAAFSKAEEIYAREPYFEGELSCLMGRGNIAYIDGEMTKAIALWQKALADPRTRVMPRAVNALEGNIGGAFVVLGKPAEAIAPLLRGHALSEECGDVHTTLNHALNLGLCYLMAGDFKKSLDALGACMPTAAELGDVYSLSYAKACSASALHKLGRHAEGLDRAEAAAATFRSLNLPQHVGDSLACAARCLRALNRHEEARNAAQRAIRAFLEGPKPMPNSVIEAFEVLVNLTSDAAEASRLAAQAVTLVDEGALQGTLEVRKTIEAFRELCR